LPVALAVFHNPLNSPGTPVQPAAYAAGQAAMELIAFTPLATPPVT
jgi:hypothetical protein